MARCRVEVVASTVEDVRAAADGGADRVEFCTHLASGGLTPGRALAELALEAARKSGLGFRVLVRPREGDFVYSPSEQRAMVLEAQALIAMGVDKVVTGGLTEDGAVDIQLIARLADAVGSEQLVFHRALDEAGGGPVPRRLLMESGVRQALTSGGAARAVDGLVNIRAAVSEGMSIVAGSGVHPEHVASFADAGVEAVHASCRIPVPSPAGRLFGMERSRVDVGQVARLVEAVRRA